ncbi:hypothetical protein NJB1507_31550 [Mycobacterium marinum]|nr:hypothetical protein NJB1507_31550 [Mycobacterium marinum]
MAAIVGLFCPSRLVATRVASRLRLAVTTAGCTVVARAVSKTLAALMACVAAVWACPAASVNHAI